MLRSLIALALLLGGVARAGDPLSPKELAAVDRELGKQIREVEKKYGNKKTSELTPEERRGYSRDRAAAEQKVLEKHGVDPRTYGHRIGRLSRTERDEVQAAAEELEAKEKAEEKKGVASKESAAGAQEVRIQRGFNENAPVTLNEAPAKPGEVVAENGIPADAKADQDEAAGGLAAPEWAPSQRESSGKKR
jgi:hypothetical protein